MAQNLDAFIPELWSRRIQYLTRNALVATQICSFEEQPDLKYGDRIHRPYPNDLVVNNYTKYTDTTQQDLIGTDEYLDIDQSKEISFAIDEVDWIQNKYDLENSYVERAAYRLANDIDGSVLGEVVNQSGVITYTVDINVDKMLSVLSDEKCAFKDYQNNLNLLVSLTEHEIKKFIKLGVVSKQIILQQRIQRGYKDNSFLDELD